MPNTCPKCGTLLEDGMLFCTQCGCRIPPAASKPAAPSAAASPAMNGNVCPKCGVALRPGAGFCINCGQKIVRAKPKPEAHAAPAPMSPTPVPPMPVSPASPAENSVIIHADSEPVRTEPRPQSDFFHRPGEL